MKSIDASNPHKCCDIPVETFQLLWVYNLQKKKKIDWYVWRKISAS